MKIEISFIGEVMLGREIGKSYTKNNHQIVDDLIKKKLVNSDFVFANLEAPVVRETDESDIMTFIAKPESLSQVDFIDGFSLANNHINDDGTKGILETISNLKEYGFLWNGFYEEKYEPLIVEKNNIKCAIICCTDVLNKEISDADLKLNLLWIDDVLVDEKIKQYKSNGYIVLLYVHGGIMFSRFPNPLFRNVLHSKMDQGVDSIITVHPHVLGCTEEYKGKPIFYSLGDFIMDGHSDRRREAAIIKLVINKDGVSSFELTPTIITNELKTVMPSEKRNKKILKSWTSTSLKLEKNKNNYDEFYKKAFRKEILLHVFSTLEYQIKNKSFIEVVITLLTRFKDFKNMGRWMIKDTSKMRNNLEDKSML